MGLLSRSLVFIGLVAGGLTWPALAHKTEVSGNVAGTWHLEPNHSPKAGEPAQVWIALTQSGGKVIPLDQCDCQLLVYAVGENDAPVIQPELAAISAENFEDIPGAELTFPEIGSYRLVLMGTPQGGARFTPFELSYTTVVAAGRHRRRENTAPIPPSEEPPATAASPSLELAQTSPPEETADAPPPDRLWWSVGAGITLVVLAVAALRLRARQLDG